MSTAQKSTSQNRHKAGALNARQQSFVHEYLIDMNATQAAIRAGYSKRTAGQMGHELLKKPEIKSAIEEAQKDRAERTKIQQDEVLTRWAELARADARDLVEYRRGACRYCHGEGHAYQWRTPREFDDAVQEATKKELPPPTDEGGYGYTHNRAPAPECPECDGVGDGRMVVKDTRTLTGGAALLYAGTNIGKDGLKVLMEDRAAALVNVAKHLGLLDPKLTLKGDAENPLQLLLGQIQGTALKPTSQPDNDDD